MERGADGGDCSGMIELKEHCLHLERELIQESKVCATRKINFGYILWVICP
jgi:hypothetical protein